MAGQPVDVRARLAVVALTVGALYSRRPDAFTNPQFFAEDGLIFFTGALRDGASSLVSPYAGYLHLYARTVALLSSPLPPLVLPALYVAANVVAVVAVAHACLSPRVPFPPSTRVVLALAVTLAPNQNEVFHTLTNAHWVLGLLLVLTLVKAPPLTKGAWAVDVGTMLCCGLSGPFALIFLPLFVINAAAKRTWHAVVLASLDLGCAIVALIHLAPTKRTGGFGLDQAREALHAVNSVIGRTFTGAWGRPPPELPLSTALLAAGGLLLVVALVVDAARQRRFETLYFLGAGALLFGSAIWAMRGDPSELKCGSARYVYIPMVTLVWSLAALWPRHRLTTTLALAPCLVAFLADHRSPPYPDFHWREASRCIHSGKPCRIVVPPDESWAFVVD